tara:strand:+ start:348 stop:503 length:156 start_codon:yes stop_codon:yes gene_type:complete
MFIEKLDFWLEKMMSEDEENKIVNLRGIAIISAFIVSSIILYIQTSQWNVP